MRTYRHTGESNQFFESLGIDVLHVPYITHYEKTPLPTVLTVHDLQHRHLPEFFPPSQLAWREEWYPQAMAHATIVVTDAEWGREDIIRQYGVSPAKVKVVPLASPIRDYRQPTADDCADLRRRLALPDEFALYPALTYGHKNHLRLLDAIAQLRDRHGVTVPVVCPGRKKLHWPVIRTRWAQLGLTSQVTFPGFVTAHDLRALYRMARLVVFPSLFEGAGLPVLEALVEGVPLACSALPPIREYAGTAARYFDPLSVDEIALTVRDLWQSEDLRRDLRHKGLVRGAEFSPARLAGAYRDLYRLAAGRSVSGPRAVAVEAAC
jgi:glycosyltransferase involved in cell wall biosynthesis